MATESEQRVVAHVAPVVPAEASVPPAPHPVKRTVYKKKHVCDHPGCGKAYGTPSRLIEHQRVHTGDRPYVCEDCGATFAQNSTLTRHKLTHTGQKPYVCEDCGATFARICTLNIHKLTHTGQKPYVCEDCGATFAHNSNLSRHKRAIHTARGQQRQKKKEESVSRFLSDAGLTFEREVVVNFCVEAERRHARVDFTIYRDWGTDIVECDEEQHHHYPIGCDAGRMLNVFAEILKRGDRAGKLRFIRYNPDAYKVDGVKQKTLKRDRQAALLKVLNSPPDQQFSVSYLFYDRTGPLPDVCMDADYPSTLRAIANAGD